MIDTSKAENRSMVCSRSFAEWLQAQYARDFDTPGSWLDAILRYCNAGYPETMREEMKKGTEYTYGIKRNQDLITLVPSYELVEIHADNEINMKHAKTVDYFLDRYSVLTTAARFPGKQQFPTYMSESEWELEYLVEECIYQAQTIMKRHGIDSKPGTADFRKDILDNEKELLFIDRYSYKEFARCGRDGFIDNQMPYSFGPSCVDRTVSILLYHNALRGLYRSFGELCRSEQIEKTYQDIFLTAMCSCAVLWCSRTGGLTICLAQLLEETEKTYLEYIRKFDGTGAETCEGFELTAAADMVSLFMNYRISCVMEDIEACTSRDLDDLRKEAWKQREHTYEGYMTPQEVYGS